MSQAKEYIKGFAILIGIAIVGFALKGVILGGASQDASIAANSATIDPNEVQYATLKMKNYAYVMEPATLKVGVPVIMTVDLDTVYGCTRDVVIPEYGVKKYVSEGDNIIRFTPTKTGSLPVSCSMGMAQGSFKVK